MSRTLAVSAAVAALLAAAPAQALVIKPTDATASTFFSGTYTPLNTLDNSGLSITDTTDPGYLTQAHAAYSSGSGGNHWTTARNNVVGAFITWTFAGLSEAPDIGTFWFWNHQSNGGLASNANYDVTTFDLSVSHAGGTTDLTGLSMTPDNAFAQGYGFGTLFLDVTSITFTVQATQGSTPFTGLAEAAFEDTVLGAAVPVPAAAPLLLAGLAAFGLIRRRG